MSDILIIDDEADICELVSGILSDEGYSAYSCSTDNDVLATLQEAQPKLIFLDIWLEGSRMDGMALLTFIKNNYPDIPVIMISGHGTIESAVAAIKRGAYDFIEKPFNADRLILAAERALETSILKSKINELKKQHMPSIALIGQSPLIKKLQQNIEKLAGTNSRIMLLAPPGTGKEMVAQAIHAKSLRAKQEFIMLNSSCIAPIAIDDEIFGCEDDNGKKQAGLLEQAHNGTLYIDELADIPIQVQLKLLKWLITNSFKRNGGTEDLKVDVRVITASSLDIAKALEDNIINKDLYNRLAVVPITIPALEERREDIPVLVEYFIQHIANAQNIKPRNFAQDAMAILQNYNWPGNIRQLRNNIERLLILAGEESTNKDIKAEMIPPEICDPLSKELTQNTENIMAMPLREARELFEKKYLLTKLERFAGNISKTADDIGMERSALHRKLKILNINYKE